jgi:hypothetical protein
MPVERKPTARSRFRSPDGKMILYRAADGTCATHAVFSKRPRRRGWYLTKGYESREAAENAISTIDPAWVIDVDYMIVEREPL